MRCEHFGACGSCILYPSYQEQLEKKVAFFKEIFKEEFEVFKSKESHFRARAEFRIKEENYAMYSPQKKLIPITSCPIVLEPIYNLMPSLLKELKKRELLDKLFRIDFLSSLNQETLITLIYHKKLDESFQERAKELKEELKVDIVGRSKGVKIVVEREFIVEKLKVFTKEFRYLHFEGSFTQPNPYINQKMLEWVVKNSKEFGGDLLELYCGNGNFTLPLAQNFNQVLATEASKTSIKVAQENAKLNEISNISFVRLLAHEVTQALEKRRVFRRLKGVELDKFEFSTIFVDPPRCGVDEESLNLLRKFENIIYISCNPKTLARDLNLLPQTHKIEKLALFDQFPYTPHLESGVILKRVI